MRVKIIKLFFCLLLLSLISGCAASNYSRGRSEMKRENFDQAIESFKLALKDNPHDPRIIRDSGIAYFRKLKFDLSISLLSKALELNPTDGLTLFYLGAAYEIQGNYKEAIDKYRRYSQVSAVGNVRKSIEGRLQRLIYKQIAEEAKAAIVQEAALDVADIPNNTVAVLYFKNMGDAKELDPLQKGLADMIITDLSKARSLKVIERIRMQKLLEEMGLGMTGMVDEATAPRVGKLLGAAEIVNGTFINLEPENIRIDGNITDATTGQFALTKHVAGALKGFFTIEKALVFNILDQMGVQLTQEEKDQIRIIPTENLLAFLAYCQGLDYEDRGMFEEAKNQFQQAIQLDPDFDLAKNKIEVTEASIEGGKEINTLVQEVEAPTKAAETTISPTISTRLQQTQLTISAGFIPGIDSRDPLQEQSQQTFGNTANIKVVVPIPH